MALRKFVERLTKPVDEIDRRELETWCDGLSCTQIADVTPRQSARVAGEVRSVRIVPRAGADALEVTLYDGRASITGVFLGRRKIIGLSPGRRAVFEGMVTLHRRQAQIYNPIYTLVP